MEAIVVFVYIIIVAIAMGVFAIVVDRKYGDGSEQKDKKPRENKL